MDSLWQITLLEELRVPNLFAQNLLQRTEVRSPLGILVDECLFLFVN